MKQQFVKVKIHSERGYVNGCIDISKLIAFREHSYDCNVIIVYTETHVFKVYAKFKEFCELIGAI